MSRLSRSPFDKEHSGLNASYQVGSRGRLEIHDMLPSSTAIALMLVRSASEQPAPTILDVSGLNLARR